MSDPSGQNLRTPLPSEIAQETAKQGPAPTGTRGRVKALALFAAFLCGALAVAGVFQLARSPAYLGGVSLLAGALTGIIAALLARKDVSLPAVHRLFALVAAGAAAAGLGYFIGFITYSPQPPFALAHIQPLSESNVDVQAYGTARFAVSVPSSYDRLTISFAVSPFVISNATSSPGPPANCINGSQEAITPTFNATLGPAQTVATETADVVQIPSGISSFTLDVQFVPQVGYPYCHEDILVSAAQFSH
jgi:hypothetical protein